MSARTMENKDNMRRRGDSSAPAGPEVHLLGDGPADRIYQAMLEAIVHLSPGTKLPSEREMMERNNITRQTARVVLNRLMREGVVERRIGSGTFVSERYPAEPDTGDRDDVDAGLIDVLEARRGLDPLVVELATERASPRDIDRIERILNKLTASHDLGEIKRLCYDFQMALAEATRNPILVANYKILYISRRNLGWDRLKWQNKNGNSRQELIRRQTEIFQAIKQRDRFTAVSLVLRDLDRLQNLTMGPRVLGYPKEDDTGPEML